MHRGWRSSKQAIFSYRAAKGENAFNNLRLRRYSWSETEYRHFMSAQDTRILLDLLRASEHMSARRYRGDLFRDLCFFVRGTLRAEAVLLYSVQLAIDGVNVVPVGWCVDGTEGGNWSDTESEGVLPADPFLGAAIEAKTPWYRVRGDHGHRIAIPVSNDGRVTWVLEVHLQDSPSTRVLQGLVTVVRTFEHLMVQWEHANLDTLTRLLNRKTFDDQFERLLALAESNRQWLSERRRQGVKHPCWLGIVDIDHFKSINDNWGHLFGDEVLILMAQCMRKAFRNEDTLFRFGGEEFVIMLRHVPEDVVSDIFERFRHSVETYDFPQIGRVTCSVGFCRVDTERTPAELLGRADEALYYAKDHGRNQVRNHDELVMQGLIKTVPPHNAQDDADIYF